MTRINKPLLVLGFALSFAGCAPTVPRSMPDTTAVAPGDFPESFYQQASAQGQPVYRIDSDHSRVVIRTYRGGALAALGHDHVIASHDVRGYALPAASRADVYVPLRTLTVDEPALRADAGLTTQPSASDIAGTQRNMLLVLQTDAHPFAVLRVNRIEHDAPLAVLDATLTLHGVSRALRIPVEITQDATQLRVAGQFTVLQTEFGLVPYAILGGALQVPDQVDVRFYLIAPRLVLPGG